MRAVLAAVAELTAVAVVTAATDEDSGVVASVVVAVLPTTDEVDPDMDPVVASLAQPATVSRKTPTVSINRSGRRGLTG